MLFGSLLIGRDLDQVEINNADVYNFGITGTIYSGIQLNTSGQEFENAGPTSQSFTLPRGKWLNSGSSSAVWVERTVNSGSLNWQDPGTGRLQMNTTREYGVSRTAVGTGTANVTFDAYDAASGGNQLDSVTLDISAEKDNNF